MKKLKKFISNLKKVFGYLKGHKGLIILYILIAISSILIGIIMPILSAKMIINLTNNKLKQLLIVAVILYGIRLLMNFLSYAFQILVKKIENIIYYDLSNDICKSVITFKDSIVKKVGTGTITQRIFDDSKTMIRNFSSSSASISSVFGNIGILVSIFIVNKIVFAYIIFKLILYYLIANKGTNKFIDKDKKGKILREKVTSFITELVRGQHDIKMLNSESSFLNKTSKALNENVDYEYETSKITTRYYVLYRGVAQDILEFIQILLYIYLIYIGNLNPSNALILYNFSSQVSWMSFSINSFIEDIKRFNLSCDRVYELIDSKKFEKETFGNVHLGHVNGNFEFSNVHFKYDKNEVIKGMSFKVKANSTVAFVGRSGVGKSTVFNLLCKMYDNYTGLITIDGHDIKTLDKDSIRGNITIVSQDPYIFNMSIKDNLKLVKDDVTDKEINEALKTASLYDFVMSLPKKLDTVVGEGGVMLSGGQKQRLAIARALIQKTEIILFDEATSSLDNITQSDITDAINNMKQDYTILIIAHRLSTIKNADKIFYIEDGKVAASGTHEELLRKSKGYKRLYDSELKKNHKKNETIEK